MRAVLAVVAGVGSLATFVFGCFALVDFAAGAARVGSHTPTHKSVVVDHDTSSTTYVGPGMVGPQLHTTMLLPPNGIVLTAAGLPLVP